VELVLDFLLVLLTFVVFELALLFTFVVIPLGAYIVADKFDLLGKE
jgi:hypothetical protein